MSLSESQLAYFDLVSQSVKLYLSVSRLIPVPVCLVSGLLQQSVADGKSFKIGKLVK